MKDTWNRRQVLKQLAATSAAAVLPRHAVAKILLEEPTPEREIQITSVSENTVRLSVLPVREDKTVAIPLNGSLAHTSWGAPTQKLQSDSPAREFQAGNLQVHVSQTPLVFTISTLNGRQIQRLKIEAGSGVVSFATGNSPLLGLGENLSREKASLRCADLSRHRLLPFRMEHGKWIFLVELPRISRAERNHREASQR